MAFVPSYIGLQAQGALKGRVEALRRFLEACRLCPRQCGVNRLKGEKGYCRAGADLMVSSAFPHFGEERPLVGRGGSGTVFLTHCGLRCVFCQNDEISHGGNGRIVSPGELARIMIGLQSAGCHNINWVTPTHYAPHLVAALPEAIGLGLSVPIVYNSSGYESVEVLQFLEGIVDIYMPDAKFADPAPSERYFSAPDYPETAREALLEMHRQVGDLVVDPRGIAERGLLVRHLVMPGGAAGTEKLMRFLVREISIHTYINIMDQYHPEHRAQEFPEINRRITAGEFREALAAARRQGLYRGF
jgi:putative pyruvate formate lyase activating enzyme